MPPIMHPITLGPDEEGWTYTLNGRTGLLIGNGELGIVHSYTLRERGTDVYFTPAPSERPGRARKIAEELFDLPDEGVRQYDRIMLVRVRCEHKCFGRPKNYFSKYKLYMFRDGLIHLRNQSVYTSGDSINYKCYVRKFVTASD